MFLFLNVQVFSDAFCYNSALWQQQHLFSHIKTTRLLYSQRRHGYPWVRAGLHVMRDLSDDGCWSTNNTFSRNWQQFAAEQFAAEQSLLEQPGRGAVTSLYHSRIHASLAPVSRLSRAGRQSRPVPYVICLYGGITWAGQGYMRADVLSLDVTRHHVRSTRVCRVCKSACIVSKRESLFSK